MFFLIISSNYVPCTYDYVRESVQIVSLYVTNFFQKIEPIGYICFPTSWQIDRLFYRYFCVFSVEFYMIM
jgi:hypothetical protein